MDAREHRPQVVTARRARPRPGHLASRRGAPPLELGQWSRPSTARVLAFVGYTTCGYRTPFQRELTSGKSTLARRLAAEIPAIRLDKDQWTMQLGFDVWDDEFRVLLEAQLWALTQELLANGQSVILEWGHWARVERAEERLRARALRVRVELHYLDAPLEELIERARRRTASGEWRAAPMTRAHFEEWATRFEPPDEDELLLFDQPVAEE